MFVCVCDCRGDNQQWLGGNFLVPVVVPREAVLGRDSQLTPESRPLSPPLLLVPLKLHSVNLLFPFEETLLCFPHLFALERTREVKESLGSVGSTVYRERELDRQG